VFNAALDLEKAVQAQLHRCHIIPPSGAGSFPVPFFFAGCADVVVQRESNLAVPQGSYEFGRMDVPLEHVTDG
jgi:hypothetical protein